MKKGELITYLEETHGWTINKKCCKTITTGCIDGVFPEPEKDQG